MIPNKSVLVGIIIREFFTFQEISAICGTTNPLSLRTESGHYLEIYDRASVLDVPRLEDTELIVYFAPSGDDEIIVRLSDCQNAGRREQC